jgi:lipoprotein-anchoring transpeptidase ErfK/SrfK
VGMAVRTVGVALALVGLSACGGQTPSGMVSPLASSSVAGAAAGSAGAAVDPSTKAEGGSAGTPAAASGGGTAVTVSAQFAVNVKGTLVVRKGPSGSAKVLARLPDTTEMGSPRVLLVRRVQAGWVQVILPTRPNGATGWVAASAVRVKTTHDQISVDLATRRISVVLDGVRVATSSVAIGSAANPTPTGTFYVTDRVRPPDPRGAYGAFALGLSAHSPTLKTFGTGDGQVGIHGTNVPASIGKAVSHGCVRVPDKVATALARVPLGTPVIIR